VETYKPKKPMNPLRGIAYASGMVYAGFTILFMSGIFKEASPGNPANFARRVFHRKPLIYGVASVASAVTFVLHLNEY